MAGHDNQYVAQSLQAVAEVRVGRQPVRKPDAREISNILTIRHHRLEQIELDDATKPNVAPGTRKLKSQRGSPGTCANDGDRS
jgi:hypothetical protein